MPQLSGLENSDATEYNRKLKELNFLVRYNYLSHLKKYITIFFMSDYITNFLKNRNFSITQEERNHRM
jgi:hypothetical protein